MSAGQSRPLRLRSDTKVTPLCGLQPRAQVSAIGQIWPRALSPIRPRSRITPHILARLTFFKLNSDHILFLYLFDGNYCFSCQVLKSEGCKVCKKNLRSFNMNTGPKLFGS